MEKKFSKLYNKKIYAFHYEQYLEDASHFEETRGAVLDIVAKYKQIENQQPKPIRRLKPLYV